ncbi:hypothetical protein PsYK624_091510 [Phanerochaete sordida]|uniref:Uncharacterized protein n=1 Tax=Phanerochaete sordida TaxID=48140 RepID=A0A9P3GC16_9APHY|nr:hypothetical protein PsYK624_091510 [Phanerochaete sordida]
MAYRLPFTLQVLYLLRNQQLARRQQQMQQAHQQQQFCFGEPMNANAASPAVQEQTNSQPPQGPQGLNGGGPSPPPATPTNAAAHNAQMYNVNTNALPQGSNELMSMQSLGQLVGTNEPSRLWAMMQFSQWSSDDLRRRGVQESIITIVENHRAILQRSYQGHVTLQNSIKGGQGWANVPQMLNHQLALAQQIRQAQAAQQAAANMSQDAPNASQPAVARPGPNGNLTGRPPVEHLQKAMEKIRHLKMMATNALQRAQVHDARLVPDDQRFQFNTVFEQLHLKASDLDQQAKLTMFACVMKEETLKRLIEIIVATQHQRMLLTSSSVPRYIMGLENARQYLQICQNVAENIAKRAQSIPLETFVLGNRGGPPQTTHIQQQANSPEILPLTDDLAMLQLNERSTPSPRPPSQ